MTHQITIGGVHLKTSGRDIIVAVEIKGTWLDIIIERNSGPLDPISHICEPGGIEDRYHHQAANPDALDSHIGTGMAGAIGGSLPEGEDPFPNAMTRKPEVK